jgi:predicted dehydrogenase
MTEGSKPRQRHGIAVIGAGMIGAAHAFGYRMHLPRFSEPLDLSLSTVCDARIEAAGHLATTYGFEKTTTDWRSVMADETIRIVSVALPNFLHAEVVAAALRAGKHVLCEKPLTLSAADARALCALAREKGRVAGTVFNYRRIPAVAEVKNLVRAGEIGKPIHLLIQYQCEYAADPRLPHSWRYVRAKAGGGALADIGTHAIDMARFLCGEISEIAGAAATTVTTRRYVPKAETVGHDHAELMGEQLPVDTDDVTSAVLIFENGCQGIFSTSRVAVGMGSTLSFVLSGTEGTVRYDATAPMQYQIARLGGSNAGAFAIVPNRPLSPYAREFLPVPYDGVPVGYAEAFGFMIAEFLTSIASGTPLLNGSLEDGLRAAEALEAIQRSVDLRRPVKLNEITDSVSIDRN